MDDHSYIRLQILYSKLEFASCLSRAFLVEYFLINIFSESCLSKSLLKIHKDGDRRDGSVVKSTCVSRGPRFSIHSRQLRAISNTRLWEPYTLAFKAPALMRTCANAGTNRTSFKIIKIGAGKMAYQLRALVL